jgi:decaprenylphospho-beta-D-erythro-pentofuranosid-2-ulose 2-reductase
MTPRPTGDARDRGERLGRIDLALIAHGVLGDQQAAEADFEVAAAILHTNFISTVSLLTWLGNYFQAQRGGTLAVVSSVAGDRGRKSNYVYGASKGRSTSFWKDCATGSTAMGCRC